MIAKGATGTMLHMTEEGLGSASKAETEGIDADASSKTDWPAGGSIKQYNASQPWNSGCKGKGYAKCWHCGGWGHPRRECKAWLELQSKGGVGALKGGSKKVIQRER